MPTRDTPWPQGSPCWVDLQVDDTTAARAYYSALFGWDVQDAPAEAGGYLMAMLDGRPAAGIGPKPAGQPMPSVWSTYLAVDDADATTATATAAGAMALMPPFDVLDLGRMTFLVDPTGAAFGVWEAKAHAGVGIVNQQGALCWNELHTRNLPAAQAFYAQVFGYEYTPMMPGYATFALPGTGPEAALGGSATTERWVCRWARPRTGSRGSRSMTSTRRWRRPPSSAARWPWDPRTRRSDGWR